MAWWNKLFGTGKNYIAKEQICGKQGEWTMHEYDNRQFLDAFSLFDKEFIDKVKSIVKAVDVDKINSVLKMVDVNDDDSITITINLKKKLKEEE